MCYVYHWWADFLPFSFHWYRALRVLKSANVILSEDTRHSGKLLHYYNIKTPLVSSWNFCLDGSAVSCFYPSFLIVSFRFQLSYHKFNESQREQTVLKRLHQGEVVALISDAGMPGISDPGMELVSISKMLTLCFVILWKFWRKNVHILYVLYEAQNAMTNGATHCAVHRKYYIGQPVKNAESTVLQVFIGSIMHSLYRLLLK